MKKYLLLSVAITLFILVNCRKESQRFVIVNNTDEEIIACHNGASFLKDSSCFMHPSLITDREYKEILRSARILPHSFKNIVVWGDYMSLVDTMYIGIFNRKDWDAMSFEEFKAKYPLKHEFKVTLEDMINCDWTLYYPLEKEEK